MRRNFRFLCYDYERKKSHNKLATWKAETRPQESTRIQDLASFSRVNLKKKLKDKTKTSHGKH